MQKLRIRVHLKQQLNPSRMVGRFKNLWLAGSIRHLANKVREGVFPFLLIGVCSVVEVQELVVAISVAGEGPAKHVGSLRHDRQRHFVFVGFLQIHGHVVHESFGGRSHFQQRTQPRFAHDERMRVHGLEQTGRTKLLIQTHQRVQKCGSTSPRTDNHQRCVRLSVLNAATMHYAFCQRDGGCADAAERQVRNLAPVARRDAKSVLE